jgi:alkylated DNA repair dioxygenase AlkB
MSLPQQLQYHENIFDTQSQNTLFDSLKHDIAWKQDHIKLFGKVHPTPRLVAWYGDPHCTYTYSGVVNTPLAWTPTLLAIKDRIEQLLYPAKFN